MQSESRVQPWYNPVTGWTKYVQPVLIAGLGLALVLGGLAALNPLLAIAAALLLLLLVVVLPRPVLIVYGLGLTQPLVGGMARGAGIPFLRLGQALLLAGFILFLLAKTGRLGKSRLTAIDLAFVLYFLAESVFPVLAILYRGDPLNLYTADAFTGTTGLQTFLGPIQYYLLYRIVVATISSEKQIKMVLSLSFVSSIIVSVIGILQKLHVGPVRAILDTYYPTINLGYTVPDYELRITSTLASYSGLAAYLSFTIIVALACYTMQKQLKISSLLIGATLLFDSIALILTGTFSPLFGLAIGALIVFMLMRRVPRLVFFVLLGIIIAGIIFWPFISDRIVGWIGGGPGQGFFPTYASRIRLWKDLFLPAIAQHIWFGSGPAPAALQYWPSEESQYFALLLKGGIFDLLSYLLLMGVAIAACWRQIKSDHESAGRVVVIATLAILVAINVMNVSAVYFTYVGGTQVLWTLLAIVVGTGQLKALRSSAAGRPIMNNKGAGIPFNSSRSLASVTAVDGPFIERYLTREKNATGSYNPLSNFTGLRVNAEGRYRRSFTWMQRLLDWHFVKDSVIVGAGFTVSRVLGLLFVTLLARFLTPDDFGFFRYVIALVSIITIVSNSSPNSIARFLASHPNDSQARDGYFTNGLVGLALVLILSLLISFPLLWLLHALDLGALICVICLAVFYGYFYLVRGLSSAWKMGLLNVVSNIFLVLALLIVIGLFNMRTATIALVIYGLADVVPILVMELVRPMALRFRPSLISRAALLELARFAMPIVIASGTYTVWFEIDILLIGNYYPHMAGSYATAKTLSLAFIFVPSAITMVLMPKVAASRADKGKRYMVGAVLTGFLLCLAG